MPFGIFSVNPGPPRYKKSPTQVVRRSKSYPARTATKPRKPAVAAAPAAPDVPCVTIGGGTGITYGGYQADAVVGKDEVRATAHTSVAAVMRNILLVLT